MQLAEMCRSSAEQLRTENEQLLEFLYLAPIGFALIDTRGAVSMMNPAGAQLLLQLSGGASLGNLFDVLAPYAPELGDIVRRYPAAQGRICEGVRIDLSPPEGGTRIRHLSIGMVKIDAARVIVLLQDVTRAVESERVHFADLERFRAIYEGMRDAMICTVDAAGRIDSWNTSGTRLFGYSLSEAMGRSLPRMIGCEQEIEGVSPFERMRRSDRGELQGWSIRRDGSRFWAEAALSPLHGEAGELSGYSVVLHERTGRKLASDKLVEQAGTDPLTGLANRRAWYERAEQEVSRALRHQTRLSLLMIDADHFKSVNDRYGHAAGDEILRHLSVTLKGSLRSHDLAGRWGGEEFIVLLPETDARGALVLANRIGAAIASSPVAFAGNNIRYTVSLGVTEATGDLREALSAADAALYRAKREGRNRAVLEP